MNWTQMKKIEPRLAELEREARAAGEAGRGWFDTWRDLVEPLSKIVGHGSAGRFRKAKDYETARRALLFAWGNFDREQGPPPWEVEGETTPMFPGLLSHG